MIELVGEWLIVFTTTADANRARGKIPTGQKAEKYGEKVGKEGVSNIEEAVFLPPDTLYQVYLYMWRTNQADKEKVNNARSQAKPDERIPEITQKAGGRLDEAREKVNAGVDKMDRKVEEKAAEAKGGLSGWFGGGK